MTLAQLVRDYIDNPGSDIGQHLPRLMELVLDHQAKTVIELGVRWGESTAAFLHALDATDGELWSVDVDDCVRQVNPLVRSHPRWKFRQGNDLEWVEHLPPAEIVFIDTSHELDQTRAELAAYEPLVLQGGCFALHDTTSFPDGVGKAVEEFVAVHPDWGFEHNPECNGLAVLTRPL